MSAEDCGSGPRSAERSTDVCLRRPRRPVRGRVPPRPAPRSGCTGRRPRRRGSGALQGRGRLARPAPGIPRADRRDGRRATVRLRRARPASTDGPSRGGAAPGPRDDGPGTLASRASRPAARGDRRVRSCDREQAGRPGTGRPPPTPGHSLAMGLRRPRGRRPLALHAAPAGASTPDPISVSGPVPRRRDPGQGDLSRPPHRRGADRPDRGTARTDGLVRPFAGLPTPGLPRPLNASGRSAGRGRS